MRRKPMISVNAATGLIEAIEAAGGDPDRILSSLGLDRSLFSEPGGFIASSDFTRVLEQAARVTGDDCFGLHFGERYHPKDVGPVIYVVLNSPTFAVGFENMGRYLRVHNEAAKVSFVIEGSRAYARYLQTDLPVELTRQHNEYSLAVGLGTIRLMAGSQWTPLEVQFAHRAPPESAEHLRVFGAPVSFGCATNAFVIERELVERPVPAADERLYPILKRYLDRVLEEMPREDRLLASVRRAVAESMRNGDPTLAQVARRIAMSPRTLQRRLGEYGVDFRGLVDDTRRRFSLTYLRDVKNTLSEIAYLVGYSEVSAFNRAFKRWSGLTPSEYRRIHSSDSSSI
ncbi:MAG: AraC family transcriptional regulator [Candidatus Rokuibacteriota bacterium]